MMDAAVRTARVAFLQEYCGVPYSVIEDHSWAQWEHPYNGWSVAHFLAEYLNSQDARPEEWEALQVDDFLHRFVRRGGNLDTAVRPWEPAQGKTPLLMVCQKQARRQYHSEEHEGAVAELARLFLKWGASPEMRQQVPNGRSPLAVAASQNRMAVAACLIAYGASPFSCSEPGGESVIDFLRHNRFHGAKRIGELTLLYNVRHPRDEPSLADIDL